MKEAALLLSLLWRLTLAQIAAPPAGFFNYRQVGAGSYPGRQGSSYGQYPAQRGGYPSQVMPSASGYRQSGTYSNYQGGRYGQSNYRRSQPTYSGQQGYTGQQQRSVVQQRVYPQPQPRPVPGYPTYPQAPAPVAAPPAQAGPSPNSAGSNSNNEITTLLIKKILEKKEAAQPADKGTQPAKWNVQLCEKFCPKAKPGTEGNRFCPASNVCRLGPREPNSPPPVETKCQMCIDLVPHLPEPKENVPFVSCCQCPGAAMPLGGKSVCQCPVGESFFLEDNQCKPF